MSYFTWTNELDLGVDKMNDEHKVLIDLMNKLYDNDKRGANKAIITSDLEKLMSWTKEHFQHEEEFMESFNYPKINQHKLIHQKLIKDLTKHYEDYKAGSSPNLSEGFYSFLKLWLQAHIMGIDMQYGRHLQAA